MFTHVASKSPGSKGSNGPFAEAEVDTLGGTFVSLTAGSLDLVAWESGDCAYVVSKNSGPKRFDCCTITNSVFVDACKIGLAHDSFSSSVASVVLG